MPTAFLDRLPLPSIQTYTTISVILLSCSIYYAVQVTSDFEWKFTNYIDNDNTYGRNVSALKDVPLDEVLFKLAIVKRISEITCFMLQEPLCIWTLINMAYCCLILVGKFIQKLVFGDLRVSEQQHIKDKFWNFVFYKFIFIFGVMNVQFIEEVILWSSWFSFLGFLHLLAQLCKDRFEYLSFSPTTPKKTHLRLLILLCIILTLAFGLIGTCVFVGFQVGMNTFAFMAVECLLVTLRTLYVVVRYGIHLWDISHDGVWEKRASYVYYTELIFEMVALVLDFIHHLHMLLWGNIFLSMASLVILMQLRYLFYEIRHRLRKYKNYLRIVRHMETTYPLADSYELENNNDDCAICWDHMNFARKLPCGHLFHNSCLRSWLEQDTSCPTCRKSLTEADSNQKLVSDSSNSFLDGNSHFQDSDISQTSNHYFPFGSHYTSWWPTFSIEVSRSNLTHIGDITDSQNSRLDNMAREVQRMFPYVPLSQITDDLKITHSIEMTIEHILDEKLAATIPSSPTPSTKILQEQDTLHEPDIELQDNLQLNCPPVKEIDMTAAASSQTYLEDTVLPLSESEDERGEKQSVCMPSSSGLGVRFSKSPEERQSILSHRKEEMIEIARRKYLNRLAVQNSVSEKAALTSLEERINRNRSRNMLRSLFMRLREM